MKLVPVYPITFGCDIHLVNVRTGDHIATVIGDNNHAFQRKNLLSILKAVNGQPYKIDEKVKES
jgi:hypothetical protein